VDFWFCHWRVDPVDLNGLESKMRNSIALLRDGEALNLADVDFWFCHWRVDPVDLNGLESKMRNSIALLRDGEALKLAYVDFRFCHWGVDRVDSNDLEPKMRNSIEKDEGLAQDCMVDFHNLHLNFLAASVDLIAQRFHGAYVEVIKKCLVHFDVHHKF
jgi:hypothetical protein